MQSECGSMRIESLSLGGRGLRVLVEAAAATRARVGSAVVRTLTDRESAEVRRSEVIVSLTTYPKRIGFIHLVLRSLLQQTQMPSRVVLTLCAGQFPDGEASLPLSLRRILSSNSDILEIVWVENDTRSYKKLLPVIDRYPGSVIITVDDDAIYSRTLVERLWAGHLVHPDTVIGTRGTIISLDESGFRPYRSWAAAPAGMTSPLVFLTGVGGILYPSGALSPAFRNERDAMDVCPDADDIWFKLASWDSGMLTTSLAAPELYIALPFSLRSSLWRKNLADGGNDVILRNLPRRYVPDRLIE